MKIITLSKDNEFSTILEAVIALKNGKILIAPSDTIYGIYADAKNIDAINKIFALKIRPKNKPISVFIDSFKMLNDVAYVNNEKVMKFLEKIWPGKTTCVLPSRGWMPLELRGKDDLNIGVRMPCHSFLLSLIKSFGGIIAQTSANISGENGTTKINEVISSFKNMPLKPDLIIETGDLPESDPSTVIDCAVWPPKIIREGAVSTTEIEEYVKMV